MNSLKDQLSNLESEIMMKTTENQNLSEKVASLTKLKENEKNVSSNSYIHVY